MTVRTWFRVHATSAALFTAWPALSGCSISSGGPEYTELGIRSEDASSVLLASSCTPLPVLPGGTVERDLALAPGLSAHVLALRDFAEVTLRGVENPAEAQRFFSQETLYRGTLDLLSVTTDTGSRYTLTFVSPCDATQMPP